MNSADIRRAFLDHFARRNDHLEVPSGSLVPSAYDPSVLLTTAGMQPFKPYFAGLETPPRTRLTSCQKCFRTPDIDEVGLTARHMTFFEMLGNFSFGDYFKQGAIEMAWELVIDVLGIDPDRLWVTVHAGDPTLGLGPDDEARALWRAVGVRDERIVALGDDNFWKAGPTGPCGPCSEIYYDRGPEWGPDGQPGDDGDRYLEFYNLVFMQYTRDAEGRLSELPSQNIDTGMGLERISSILQGNVSIFEIDSVQPIVRWAEQRSGLGYGEEVAATKAMRVLVDHGRSMSFLASDGVQPSNEGRGYVLRRIIRRAIQHADRLGLYEQRTPGVLAELHGLVIDGFGGHYPELVEQRDHVSSLLHAEEERFLRTLDKGSILLHELIADTPAGQAVPGDLAFQLHDTFGFPVELTAEIASERGLGIDRARFDELMREQRERARAAAGSGSLPIDQAAAFVRSAPASEFVGYDTFELETTITACMPIDDDDLGRLLVKLERSPFYAEGGGQVADAGTITGPSGRAVVEHAVRFDGDQVLIVRIDGTIGAGERVTAAVDLDQRLPTQSNHTATHLLHAALRDVLGDHVRQAGSLVEPGRLRFDFSHGHGLAPQEIARVEELANAHVAAAEPVRWEEVDIDTARTRGATMLFGEKYGDRVRMVSVGDGTWSLELCGGTHVSNTGQIGTVLIVSESSVSAGTRRIEALTGAGAVRWLRERADAADAAARALGIDVQRLPDRALELQQTARRLEKELSSLRSGGALDAALAARIDTGPFAVIAYRDDSLGGDELLDLADRIKGRVGSSAVVILGSAAGATGKVTLIVSAAEEAVKAGAHAGKIVQAVAGIVGGGGGGRPHMARAGGTDASRLDEALAAGRTVVSELA